MTTDHQAQVDAAREECKRLAEDYSDEVVKYIAGEPHHQDGKRELFHAAIDRLAALASAPHAPAAMTPIYVCPTRDIECGRNQTTWCNGCPQWKTAPSTICGTSIQAPAPAASSDAQPIALAQMAKDIMSIQAFLAANGVIGAKRFDDGEDGAALKGEHP